MKQSHYLPMFYMFYLFTTLLGKINATTYTRNSKGLKAFPQNIPHNVTHINLQNNKITEIGLLELPKLKTLILGTNNIANISKYALQYTLINTLGLNDNRLLAVPNVCNISKTLKDLRLGCNYIHTIDPELVNCLTHLEKLDLHGNKIDKIPDMTFQNTQIKLLNLSHNELMDIPEVCNISETLEELNLAHNNIHIVNAKFINCSTNLRILNLRGNNITEVSHHVFKDTQLELLDLSMNELLVVPDVSIISDTLEELNLAHNNIHIVYPEFINCSTNLVILNLRGNNISEVSHHVFNNTQLELLDLSMNEMVVVPDVCIISDTLKELNLAHNSIQTVNPEYIYCSTNLRILNLRGNNISEVPHHVFKNTQLELLDLSMNKLVDIPDLCNISQTLKTLSLGNNNIQRVGLQFISCLKNLTFLYLRGNNITNILDFTFNNTQIELLDLSMNELLVVPDLCHISKTLKSLQLDNNHIQNVNPEFIHCLTNLEKLYLSGNDITNISVFTFNNTQIELLDLSMNELGDIPDVCTISQTLKDLRLGSNNIQHLVKPQLINCLVNITKLWLDNNPLTLLAEETFVQLFKLKQLYLDNTYITSPPILENMHLSLLSLSSTLLTTYPDPSLLNSSIKAIDLSLTNLVCNCSITWLKMSTQRVEMGVRPCMSPPEMKNRSWKTLTISDLCPAMSTNSTPASDISTEPNSESVSDVSTEPNSVSVSGVSTEPNSASASDISTEPNSASASDISTEPNSVSVRDVSTEPNSESVSGVSTEPNSESASDVSTETNSKSLSDFSTEPNSASASDISADPSSLTVNGFSTEYGSASIEPSTAAIFTGLLTKDDGGVSTTESIHVTEIGSPDVGDGESSPIPNLRDFRLTWSVWLPWTQCSKLCDRGIRTRIRLCYGQYCGIPKKSLGLNANKNITIGEEIADCNSYMCSGVWLPWYEWSSCSESCGPGLQTRKRTCEKDPQSLSCEGNELEVLSCTGNMCTAEESNSEVSGAAKLDEDEKFTRADQRPLAKVSGFVGILFITISVALVVVPDFLQYVRWLSGKEGTPRRRNNVI